MRVHLALEGGHSTLAALLAVAIFNVHLLGRAQVWSEISGQRSEIRNPTSDFRPLTSGFLGAVVAESGFEPLPFEEAIEFFRGKTNVSPERFRNMEQAARRKAFTISAGANRQITDTVREILDRALRQGVTLDQFKDRAADVLDAAGVSEKSPWYWETVYRTNMQTSYQAGRWQQMTDPAVVQQRPYIRYVSARLPTTRPSHREKHGVIFAADHPFWDRWMPPNGFNCYCQTQSVSRSLLERRGWTVSTEMNFRYPDPDAGFEVNAGRTETV